MKHVKTYLIFEKLSAFEDSSKSKILTSKFIAKLLDDPLVSEYFINLYISENELDQDQIPDHKDRAFLSWLRSELEWRISIVMEEVLSKITDGFVRVWRKMAVNDEWIEDIANKEKSLGIYWTWSRDSAGSYWADLKDAREVELEAEVPVSSIDLVGTIQAGLDPLHWGEENEIRLVKGARVNLISVKYRNRVVKTNPHLRYTA